LLLATLSHQPSFQTDFPGYARYVTTPQFLLSHLVGSILGAALGVLGLVALFVVLTRRGIPRLALGALISSVLGTMLITSVFGVAAFAQPAIGQAYLAGQTEAAIAMNQEIYGPALVATALPGLVLFTLGIVLFGVAVTRAPDAEARGVRLRARRRGVCRAGLSALQLRAAGRGRPDAGQHGLDRPGGAARLTVRRLVYGDPRLPSRPVDADSRFTARIAVAAHPPPGLCPG